jgi:ribosomal protein S18 acetylase RimI-like enzyme
MHAKADVSIRPLSGPREIEHCARMMRDSEPWVTLGRGYESGLAMLADEERERHVAIVDQEIAGFVVLLMRGAFAGYLQTICVAPAFRRHGIGRALMEFAEALAFSRHPNLFLTVSDFNAQALAFYRRLGYQVVGELRDYIVTGHSETMLRKSRGPLRGYTPIGTKA